MPKLSIPLDEFTVTQTARRIWRQQRGTITSYDAGEPSPFEEPMIQALIQALVVSINAAVERAIVTYPENADSLAHMSVFHPVDGWVPLCKAGIHVTGTCLECTNKANPR